MVERKKRNRKRLVTSDEAKETRVQSTDSLDESSDTEVLEGRYEVVKELGRGGMGIVYEAFDRELEMPVAVKVLPPEFSANSRAITDLKREARLAMSLRHPSVAALYHFAHASDKKFLVMELLKGESLEQRLQRCEVLEVDEVIDLAIDMASALDYAHSEKVVHRDIKPDNIFIHEKNGEEQVRIMDFGIARQIKDSMTRMTRQDSSGTLLYMPPEQLQGKRVDGRADIYALAATLYECLAGTPPFYQGGIEYQIVNNVPEPIDGIPDEINAALLKALEKLPEDRFSSAGEFADALSGDDSIGYEDSSADDGVADDDDVDDIDYDDGGLAGDDDVDDADDVDPEDSDVTEDFIDVNELDEETGYPVHMPEIDPEITCDMQGISEDRFYTGEFEPVELGHLTGEDIYDLLIDVVDMEIREDNEDLCPAALYFRYGDHYLSILVSDGELSMSVEIDGDLSDWSVVTIPEAIMEIAHLIDNSDSAGLGSGTSPASSASTGSGSAAASKASVSKAQASTSGVSATTGNAQDTGSTQEVEARRAQIMSATGSNLGVSGPATTVKVWNSSWLFGLSWFIIPFGIFVALVVLGEARPKDVEDGLAFGAFSLVVGFGARAIGIKKLQIGIDKPSDAIYFLRGGKRIIQKRLSDMSHAVLNQVNTDDGDHEVGIVLKGRTKPWRIEGLGVATKGDGTSIVDAINKLLSQV